MASKLVLNREAFAVVLEQHRANLHPDEETQTLLLAFCPCGWESNAYEHPRTWWEEDPTRVAIRAEFFEHLIDVLEKEAGWRE